jgi:hypothetical protein
MRGKAGVPAALGMIEDITTFVDPSSTGNLTNLKATGRSASSIQAIVDHATEFYRSMGRFPLYPEIVLDSMLRNDVSGIKTCVSKMQRIASRFGSDTLDSCLDELAEVWDLYTRQGGFAHGRPEPTIGVVSSAISGIGPLSGSETI